MYEYCGTDFLIWLLNMEQRCKITAEFRITRLYLHNLILLTVIQVTFIVYSYRNDHVVQDGTDALHVQQVSEQCTMQLSSTQIN